MNDTQRLWLLTMGQDPGEFDEPQAEEIRKVWDSFGPVEAGTMPWLNRLRAFNEACDRLFVPGYHQEVHEAAWRHWKDQDARATDSFRREREEIKRTGSDSIRKIRAQRLGDRIHEYFTGQ